MPTNYVYIHVTFFLCTCMPVNAYARARCACVFHIFYFCVVRIRRTAAVRIRITYLRSVYIHTIYRYDPDIIVHDCITVDYSPITPILYYCCGFIDTLFLLSRMFSVSFLPACLLPTCNRSRRDPAHRNTIRVSREKLFESNQKRIHIAFPDS